VEVQQATKVQAMAEAQQRVMEMERRETKAVMKRRCTILDRATLLDKGIKILDPKRFMWTQMKETMTNMVNGWKTRRILLRKKIGLLKQGLFLCS